MNGDNAFPITETVNISLKDTERTRVRYSRIAPFYDLFETLPELLYKPWRKKFWHSVEKDLGSKRKLLEIGLGTGKNMPYWPQNADITGIELAPKMLIRAKDRAARLGISPELNLGDVQSVEFEDDTFDVAAATFVFCSVPNPILGLQEVRRVVKPGGRLFLLEHVRAQNRFLGFLMDVLNPFVARIMGPNINRDTVGNVVASGLDLIRVEDLGMGGIFKLITALVP